MKPIAGVYINTMAPCVEACYAEIEIGELTVAIPARGIHWEKQYELEDYEDKRVEITYTAEKGVRVYHLGAKTDFYLVGPFRKDFHPITVAKKKCFSDESLSYSALHARTCISGATEMWLAEIKRIYLERGGDKNILLKESYAAWLGHYEATSKMLRQFAGQQIGSKWLDFAPGEELRLARSYVTTLSSINRGY
jgi:hypothetical protein